MAFSYGKDYDIIGKEIAFKVPPSGILKIYRETPTDRLVEWNEGSVLLSSDMTLSQVQQLHIIEEQQLWSLENSIVLNENDMWEGRFTRIGNVADPISDQDVVTKKYMETVQGGFIQANTALKDEATKQANIATAKAGEASNSASKAAVSEANAKSYMNTASQKATVATEQANLATEKATVATTKASEASTSASAAKNSETNAKSSETNAKSSESKAGTSATNASTSATKAAVSEANAKISENEAAKFASLAEKYATNAGIRFIVISTRERGDDEPTYGVGT